MLSVDCISGYEVAVLQQKTGNRRTPRGIAAYRMFDLRVDKSRMLHVRSNRNATIVDPNRE
jgi:hypothetical protein